MSKEFDRALLSLMHDIAQEFQFRIMLRTPVDTGKAQNAWKIDKVSKDGFEIMNDVEYVPYLEEGTPNMRPYHMVRATMAEAQQIADLCATRGATT